MPERARTRPSGARACVSESRAEARGRPRTASRPPTPRRSPVERRPPQQRRAVAGATDERVVDLRDRPCRRVAVGRGHLGGTPLTSVHRSGPRDAGRIDVDLDQLGRKGRILRRRDIAERVLGRARIVCGRGAEVEVRPTGRRPRAGRRSDASPSPPDSRRPEAEGVHVVGGVPAPTRADRRTAAGHKIQVYMAPCGSGRGAASRPARWEQKCGP